MRGYGRKWHILPVLAAVLLLASCEAMPADSPASSQPSLSQPQQVQSALQEEPAAGEPSLMGAEVSPEAQSPAYRMEQYVREEDWLYCELSYPQLEGEGYDELNRLLQQEGLRVVELLEQERRQAASAGESQAESGPASSQGEGAGARTELHGGSVCYLPNEGFLSVAYTMQVSGGESFTKEWYTVNCDLHSGQQVTCADLFADLDGLAAALRRQLEADGPEEALAFLTQEQLRAGLPGVPVAFGTGFAEFGFPVPPELGDVYCVSLPLGEASDYRSDSTLWDMIGIS